MVERFVRSFVRESSLSGLWCALSDLSENQQSALFQISFNELSQPASQKSINSELIIISDWFCIALFFFIFFYMNE